MVNQRYSSFYSQEKIAQARLAFRQLRITGPEDGDRFFEAYGVGNTLDSIDRPFERFEDYEELLNLLREDDQDKYKKIHKGSPFYFLAWTAFDLKNYEKAVFYMDAAISEDIGKDSKNWLSNPASKFLVLDAQSENQSAKRITLHLRERIENELRRFNDLSNLKQITIKLFTDNFVKVLAKKKENHSIITAIYSFILEYEDRQKELELRSTNGGSIEPILTHLFKGGLIFESLLKYLYPKKDDGNLYKTLGEILGTEKFKQDFTRIPISISSDSLQEIIDQLADPPSLIGAFGTTGKLRNTTGHNLVWDNIFNVPSNFQKLYEQEVNAILYLIAKKFIDSVS